MIPELIHDWNGEDAVAPKHKVTLVDETLRDGLQSPSVRQPTIRDKLRLLHLMDDLRIEDVNIGLPAAGQRFVDDAVTLAKEIVEQGLCMQCHCAGRTLEADIVPIVEISQTVGIAMGAGLFIGSSPIRRYVEGWEVDTLLRRVRDAVTFAAKNGLRVMFVTEDTTRTDPETVRALYSTAIECGATQLVLSDTVGHAMPHGAAELVRFVRSFAGPDIEIDWHGHTDRGLALACALAAVGAGADRVHATALGIGERCGNTQMEQLLVNLQMLGYIEPRALVALPEYCRLTAKVCGLPVPVTQPVVGADAFRTASGIHAAAVIKAMKTGNRWLADRVYSGVPAALVGRKQDIEVGPMSGSSNVRYILDQMGIEPDEKLVDCILQRVKTADRAMSEVEILRTVVGVLTGRGDCV